MPPDYNLPPGGMNAPVLTYVSNHLVRRARRAPCGAKQRPVLLAGNAGRGDATRAVRFLGCVGFLAALGESAYTSAM